MKKIILLLCLLPIALFSLNSVAMNYVPANSCPVSPDHEAANFCTGFQTTVRCNCATHLGKVYCDNVSMQTLYNMMVNHYGSLANSCKMNFPTDPQQQQECVYEWTCYMNLNTPGDPISDCQIKGSDPGKSCISPNYGAFL